MGEKCFLILQPPLPPEGHFVSDRAAQTPFPSVLSTDAPAQKSL